MIRGQPARSSTHRTRIVRLLRLAALVALTFALAQRSHAQSNQVGRVEGVVFDSVHARPLAGAHVVAVGTGSRAEVRREATSDSSGRYVIDSLPLGRYFVGFENALLDSLEVALPPREAIVTPGQVVTLELAMPPAAKLRAAICPGVALPAGTGVIYGHVVNAETESPIAGVRVAMVWRDLDVERKKRVRAISLQRSESVVTDDDGWYRMCGVATGAWVSVQLQDDQRAGSVVRTHVDDTLGITIQHLSFSPVSSGAGDATAEGPARAPVSGTATLTGTVRGPGGAPVASAEVRVRNSRADTRTDAVGAFSLGGLPAGTQQLEVRHLGYAVEERTVELRSGTTTPIDVVLRRIVNLDSVVIVASRPRYRDFYAHKASGFGRFIGPEELMKQNVTRTGDIIRKIPGFLVEESGYRSILLSAQGMNAPGGCPVTLVIDGNRVPYEFGLSINDVSPFEIGAIEAYPASMASFAPPEYGIGMCGGIVIWTKR
jgi:hypothetical protein